MNTVKKMVGVGVVTIPYNLAYCGYFYGIVVFLLAALAIMWTTYLCGKVCEDYARQGVGALLYEDAVKRTLGHHAYTFTAVTIGLFCMGNIITYIIFIQNSIYLIDYHVFGIGIPMEARVLFIFLLVVPIFCIKDFSGLKNICLVGNIAMIITCIILLCK